MKKKIADWKESIKKKEYLEFYTMYNYYALRIATVAILIGIMAGVAGDYSPKTVHLIIPGWNDKVIIDTYISNLHVLSLMLFGGGGGYYLAPFMKKVFGPLLAKLLPGFLVKE